MSSKKSPAPGGMVAAPHSPPPGKSARWELAAIFVLAAFLRCVRLDSPVGGFHAFNEAHCALIAQNFATHSLLLPTPDGAYVFLETPPLYPYFLRAVFRVVGFSVLTGRLVCSRGAPKPARLPTGSGRGSTRAWPSSRSSGLFGWTLADAHPNPHFFRAGDWSLRRTGGALAFGFFPLASYPALMMVAVSEGAALYKTETGFVMRRPAP